MATGSSPLPWKLPWVESLFIVEYLLNYKDKEFPQEVTGYCLTTSADTSTVAIIFYHS